MEISERALRRMVREVDDNHREGMQTMAADIAELHYGEGRRLMGASRRSFLRRAGLGGAGIAIGSAFLPVSRLLSPALAATEGDAGVAAFAESVELAAVEAYGAAAKSGKVKTPAVLQAATTFAGHHKEHAGAFGGAAGDAATGKPNPGILKMVSDQLQDAGDEKAVLKIAYDLENAAASTYLFGLGVLESKPALQLAASILPVESQHAVVLGNVLGIKGKELIPAFETEEAALKPDKFPVG